MNPKPARSPPIFGRIHKVPCRRSDRQHHARQCLFGYDSDRRAVSYLHERQHKRELRLESAQKATGIAVSSQADLERNLLFNLRSAFVGTLQAKAVLQVAKDNLEYWDQELKISRDRFEAGDIAQIDLDRLELAARAV